MAPSVSKASGMKVRVLAIDWYFSSFRSAARSAAAPAVDDMAGKYYSDRASVNVTYQVIHLTACHGIYVNPSGRLLFLLLLLLLFWLNGRRLKFITV